MNIRNYLVIDSQNGNCRLRKSPSASFGEYVVRLDITIPKPEIPAYAIEIPLPPAQGVKVSASRKEYGIPWALSEGIMEVKSISTDGKLELDYTDAGLRRLYDEVKPRPEEGWYGMSEYARKVYGLPSIYVESSRWEPLFPAREDKQ